MRKTSLLGAAGLALLAGVLASTPTACGGSSGGVGLGIATLGVSAIFAGNSPGWNVRDPIYTRPTDGRPVTVVAVPEPAIILTPNEAIERVIVAGGRIGPLRFRSSGTCTAIAQTNNLEIRLFYAPFDAGRSLRSSGTTLDLVSRTATISSTSTAAPSAIDVVLDFSTFQVGDAATGTRIKNFTTNPGDSLLLRLRNVGLGDLRLDTAAGKTSVDYVSGQIRETVLALGSTSQGTDFDLSEVLRGDVVGLGVATDIAFAPTNFTSTAVRQATVFKTELINATGTAVAGAKVKFIATEGGVANPTPATSDASGVASAAVVWPDAAAGKDVTVTAIVLDPQGNLTSVSATATLRVVLAQQRAYDGLEVINIQSDNLPFFGQVPITAQAMANPAGSLTGKTSRPSVITYIFPKDVSTTADWRYDVFIRTRSFATNATATARLRIRVFDRNGIPGADLASQDLLVTARLQRFTGTFTPVGAANATRVVAANRGITTDFAIPLGGVELVIESFASSDPSTQGIEVSIDAAAPSTVRVPGPVVIARIEGAADDCIGSQPDPRR